MSKPITSGLFAAAKAYYAETARSLPTVCLLDDEFDELQAEMEVTGPACGVLTLLTGCYGTIVVLRGVR